MASKTKSIMDSLKHLFGRAQGELSRLRDKITATLEEIEHLSRRPIDRLTAESKLQEAITAAGRSFAEKEFRTMTFMNEASPPNTLGLSFHGVDQFEMMCFFLPELVEQKMKPVIEDFLAKNPGVDPVARREQLAELQTQLRGLELQEEALVREAGSVGMKVSRRPDASPEVVLGE